MKNVKLTFEGEELVIRVNLKTTFGRSKSGKTEIIATTEGNKRINPDDDGPAIFLGLNIYSYPERN